MAYIGNAKTPLLLASNVRDDLLPGYNDPNQTPDPSVPFDKKEFLLSQEVPGGEESNVTVVRKKFLTDSLITNSNLFSSETVTVGGFSRTKLSVSDKYLAAALSIIQPTSSNYDGDTLSIKFNSDTERSKVLSVNYTRDLIEIVLADNLGEEFDEGDKQVSIDRRYYDGWEILDPKTDYEIAGQFGTAAYNKKIIITEAPQAGDILYVLHRGDATYNFVPSPHSVGIEQLSNNLKNFTCDRFEGDSTQTLFQISQSVANERSLLVTVDGVVVESDDLSVFPTITGEWKLTEENGLQYVDFHVAPDSGAKIRVLHLGFVAGLRRGVFVPGQEPASIPNNFIDEPKLTKDSVSEEKIKANSVSTQKLKDSSVTAQKILLNASQNDGLRVQYTDGVENLISIINQSSTQVYTKSELVVKKLNQDLLKITSSDVSPGTTDTTSLGTQTNKFSNLHLSGSANVGDLTVTTGGANITGTTTISGNVSVTGNISVTGTVDSVDVSDLRDAVLALQAKVSTLIPVGTIMSSGKATPQTNDGVWLLCDGSSISKTEYQDLFDAIGYAFGGSGDNFSLPDLRRRVSVGKSSSDTLGANEGVSVESRLLTHNHTGAPHTHDLNNHTHSLPGHKHTVTSTSTLRIESTTNNPSGAHTTNISHAHPEGTTTSPYNTTNTTLNTLTHTHTFSHQHLNQSTGLGGVDHFHTGTTTAGHGAHKHGIMGRNSELGTHPNGRFFRVTGGGSIPDEINPDTGAIQSGTNISTIVSTRESEHTHPFTTGGARNTTNANVSGFLHTHPFATDIHTGRTTGPDASDNSLNHIHRFTTPTFIGTSSNPAGGTDGAHGHAANAFLGSIGADESVEGNETMISGAPSNNSTGSATYTGPTSDVSTPHIILNFIIKAKNS